MTRNRPHETDLAARVRALEAENARLKLAIARALARLPQRPAEAEAELERAIRDIVRERQP